MSPASSKLRWLWRAPARALGRARDYYIRSITGCARYVHNDAAFGAYPVMVPTELPRSQSYGPGGEEDLRALIRASSERRDDSQRQAVARSQSTAVGHSMAPIDEDAPIEFAGGVGTLYPRSQSYAGGRPPRFPRKVAVLACRANPDGCSFETVRSCCHSLCCSGPF